MPRLTWDDLLVQNISLQQFGDWISPWTNIIEGSVSPIFMSKFGLWFLRRPEDHVEMLNVFTGQIERMADKYDDFMRDVNEQWWQETCLFSELVYQLHQEHKIPGPEQCYALAPHPALGGRNPFAGDTIETKFVMVTDIIVWQSICAQTLGVS